MEYRTDSTDLHSWSESSQFDSVFTCHTYILHKIKENDLGQKEVSPGPSLKKSSYTRYKQYMYMAVIVFLLVKSSLGHIVLKNLIAIFC